MSPTEHQVAETRLRQIHRFYPNGTWSLDRWGWIYWFILWRPGRHPVYFGGPTAAEAISSAWWHLP